MSDYQRAVKALSSVPEDMPPEDEWKQFHVEDQYNPGNTLTGFLSRRSTRFYGALLISHVNNQARSQLIFCTPKLHYPFDKHGRYRFPKARRILAYDKLDGTNIMCYGYTDARGRRFWTFKSRLTPVLRDSTVVSFTVLLKETGRQEALRALAKETGWNISCELWGAKNMHLIAYTKPIELSLLFAVDQAGRVLPPESIRVQHCIPVTTFYGKVDGNYVETYNAHRVEDEARLKPHMEGYTGTEGRVWYLLTEDMLWRQFKCKPETVEQIHWSASKGISKNVVRATALNVLETDDDITIKAVNTLLKEEFDDYDILQAQKRIARVIDAIRMETVFRDQVLEKFDSLGVELNDTTKGAVMRYMSKTFEKKYMRNVYFLIKSHRGG
jgi:hypothetical protein